MSYFADVILPLPLGKYFTYSIPEELFPAIKTGSRVIVQFGAKKYYTAVVRDIHSNAPDYETKPILEVLEVLRSFDPIKICYNGFELYNDFDSNREVEPGVYGEIVPYMIAVPLRLSTALDKYDVYVNKIDIRIVHHHHSIVYLYGEKVLVEANAEKV